jgi:glycosyltransferase involved in cell wall biosynthesis
MARRADKLHVHCKSVIPELSQYFQVPSQKFFVHPHPRFPAHVNDQTEAINALRKHYGLPVDSKQRLFLIFGNIARYKRIGEVIHLFGKLPPSNRLLIAGKAKKGSRNYFASIKKMADQQKNIHLISRYIPEDHIPWFFNGVDYLIYNHRHLIASGVVELALSYKKEIIAPRKGCLQEMESRSNLLLFDNQDELRNCLHSVALNSG